MTAEWDDLARLSEQATPGEWTTYAAYGSRGVEVADTEAMLFIQDGGVTYAVNPADAEFIAAANPATILRLIADLRDYVRRRDVLLDRLSERSEAKWAAEAARDQLAARLAAVEALADETERAGDPLLRLDRLRAALSAAPTDTTKETS